jgi:hypothetical protein
VGPLMRIVLAAICFVWASAAMAQQSFVTLKPLTSNVAWYLRAEFHALHKEIRGIPVARIHESWCKATEFTLKGLPQEALDENPELSDGSYVFAVDANLDGSGSMQTALVGVFEDCNGTKGSFLLILDQGTRNIRFVSAALSDHHFSALRVEADSTLTVMYCMNCDFFGRLQWDAEKKSFEWVKDDDEEDGN